MELFDALGDDIELIYEHLSIYGNTYSPLLPKNKLNIFLRSWAKNKEHLYKAFGNNFIIKQPVEFALGEEDLVFNFQQQCCLKDYLVIDEYISRILAMFWDEPELKAKLTNFISDYKDLANNSYSGETFIIPKEHTINGKELKVQHGCKILKTFKKILDALNIQLYDYEQFRLAHARVLNQKSIKGNLCLSIHPLDFMTMSDNNCGWDTCTSWVIHSGEHRMGTLEMMNSSRVVLAYLELPEDPIYIGDFAWSNKHWRQLIVVTKDLIAGNKQYNYTNDYFEATAMTWLKELCEKELGYGPYTTELEKFNNATISTVNNKPMFINLFTTHMYNDFGVKHSVFVNQHLKTTSFNINYSAPAICASCGGFIENDADPINIECIKCSGLVKCNICGDYVYETCELDDGRQCCINCYDDYNKYDEFY